MPIVILNPYKKKCRKCRVIFDRYYDMETKIYKQKCWNCEPIPEFISVNYKENYKVTKNLGPIIDTISSPDSNYHWSRQENKYILYDGLRAMRTFQFFPPHDCIINKDNTLIIPTPNTFYKEKRRNATILFALRKFSFQDVNKYVLTYIPYSHPLHIDRDQRYMDIAPTKSIWKNYSRQHPTKFGLQYVRYVPY